VKYREPDAPGRLADRDGGGLLRVYGPERFLKLYTTCQQATFEADCRATLGIGLDELDAAFWADTCPAWH
jgi:hypothetical protein